MGVAVDSIDQCLLDDDGTAVVAGALACSLGVGGVVHVFSIYTCLYNVRHIRDDSPKYVGDQHFCRRKPTGLRLPQRQTDSTNSVDARTVSRSASRSQ